MENHERRRIRELEKRIAALERRHRKTKERETYQRRNRMELDAALKALHEERLTLVQGQLIFPLAG